MDVKHCGSAGRASVALDTGAVKAIFGLECPALLVREPHRYACCDLAGQGRRTSRGQGSSKCCWTCPRTC